MAIEGAKNSVTGGGGGRWSPLDSASGPGGDSPLKNKNNPDKNRGKTSASPDQVKAFREKQKLSKMNSAERRQYNSPTAKAKRARAERDAARKAGSPVKNTGKGSSGDLKTAGGGTIARGTKMEKGKSGYKQKAGVSKSAHAAALAKAKANRAKYIKK